MLFIVCIFRFLVKDCNWIEFWSRQNYYFYRDLDFTDNMKIRRCQRIVKKAYISAEYSSKWCCVVAIESLCRMRRPEVGIVPTFVLQTLWDSEKALLELEHDGSIHNDAHTTHVSEFLVPFAWTVPQVELTTRWQTSYIKRKNWISMWLKVIDYTF